ncbi:MAG: methyl-accepting chemotaxis protein [Candidatus Omnitrophica bacterium]|nr:methyl-accepting chemotaxis protein [Candidatus Omnitrophota bacterium]
MEQTRFQNRRRNYFIKKGFQAKFILKFCILIILACVLMGGLVYFLSTKTVTASFENLRFIAKSTADFILPLLTISSLIAIIIVSLACIVIVLFISHRIAGPLYRFEKSIGQIATGDLRVETHLRKNDEIKILADSLNTMVKKFKEPITKSLKELDELQKVLDAMRERLNRLGIAPNEINEITGPYEKKVNQIKANLSYFKTE